MKQSLDYTDSKKVVNFRDVGEFINLIVDQRLVPIDRLYRGGTIKYISDSSVVGEPKTIFCLQKGPDPDFKGIKNYHFPVSNNYEKYETTNPKVRNWLRTIVRTIEAGIEYPLYVHCLSGKDRTGVVIAALLKIISVNDEDILEEYYLSIGTEGQNHIYTALKGIQDLNSYFTGINLNIVRNSLLGEE